MEWTTLIKLIHSSPVLISYTAFTSNFHISNSSKCLYPGNTEEKRKVLVTQSSVTSMSSWTSNPTLDLVEYEDIHEEEGVEEDVSTLAKGEVVPQVDIDNRKVISKGKKKFCVS